MAEMASTSSEVLWSSTELNLLPELNRTEGEISYYLEKLNYYTFIKLLPMAVLFTVALTVGLSGNLLVFLVYLKQFKASATRVFVLEMSACDFLANLFILPIVILDMRYSYTNEISFCRAKMFLGAFPVVMSYLILVCVALDRRRRICQVHKRQLSARQAIHLLIVPLTLTLAVVVPVVLLYNTRPLETDRPGITGTTCGVTEATLEKKIREVFGVVIMAYFIAGFALLTICYTQISYRIYQQKKKLLAGKINIGFSFPVIKTHLNKGIVSCQEEMQTDMNTSESIYISTVKSEVSAEKVNNQDKHLRVETETWTRDPKDKNVLSKYNSSLSCKSRSSSREVNTEGYNTQRFFCHAEASWRSPSGKDSEADSTTSQLSQRHLGISNPVGCTHLSEPDEQPSTAKETPNGPSGKKSFVSSRDSVEDIEEINVVLLTSSAERAERSQQKRALLSKTTFMMLVMTVSAVIFSASAIGVMAAKLQPVSVHISAWQMNVYYLARFFPCVSSVINPFIYSFCNPKFRLQCRRFLTKVCNGQL